jgi:glycosyltransferase involved in cell wall biosynthesis
VTQRHGQRGRNTSTGGGLLDRDVAAGGFAVVAATPNSRGSAGLRLLVVCNGWAPAQTGGLNGYVTSVSNALNELGIPQRVLVLAPVGVADPVGPEPVAEVSDSLSRRVLAFDRALRRYGSDADVLVLHFALNAASIVLRRSRLFTVFYLHGPWSQESRAMGERRPVQLLKWLVEYLVFRRVDRFVVLSEAFAGTLRDSHRVPPERIVVVPPGVDAERFRPAPGCDRERVFVCIRRLVPRMGIDVLLRALAESRSGFLLVIVGDGVDRSRLKDLACELGVANTVTFTGQVSDEELRGLYARAWASVIPTVKLEGFGLVALESLASGTPLIASAVDALGEFLSVRFPELLVAPGDVAALSGALARAAAGTGLPASEQCVALAVEFSWTRTAERPLAEYRAPQRVTS